VDPERDATMFTFRPATDADLPALQALVDASVRALSRGYYTPQQIESALRHVFGPDPALIADGTYHVATLATGEIVAAGGWSRRRKRHGGDQESGDGPLDPARDAAGIRAFYVHPRWARRGLARQLLMRCATEAAAAGFRALELVATLPGEPLYRALGFEEVGRTEAVMPDGTRLEAVAMRRGVAVGP
jgi:GNAT superfamily N-acetyltransferase